MITSSLLQTLPPKQFLASRTSIDSAVGFHHTRYDDWHIYTSADVPCVRVAGTGGTERGLIIGWIVDDGRVLKSGDTLILSKEQASSDLPLRTFWGRYLHFEIAGEDTKVTTDAGGLFPLVYHQKAALLASSPSLIEELADTTKHEGLTDRYNLGKRHGWFAFGLTPRKEISRVLPNHTLNLRTFETNRNWPAREISMRLGTGEQNSGSTVERIAALIESRVKAFARNGNFRVHLTAGYDTRMLLAACKATLDNVTFQTYDLPVSVAKLDSHVAAHIAKRFGLKHRFLPYTETGDTEQSNWLYRTGYCINDNVTKMAAMEKANFDGSYTLAGISGEVGRAFYWGDDDIGATGLTVDDLLKRLRLPEIEPFLSACHSWLDSVPAGPRTWILDLAYIELRLGCWAGAAMPGHDIPHPTLSPFNSIDCYELMLSLGHKYRVQQRMCDDFIDHLWPELLSVPVNRAVGLQKLRFLKKEASLLLPKPLKQAIKRIVSR